MPSPIAWNWRWVGSFAVTLSVMLFKWILNRNARVHNFAKSLRNAHKIVNSVWILPKWTGTPFSKKYLNRNGVPVRSGWIAPLSVMLFKWILNRNARVHNFAKSLRNAHKIVNSVWILPKWSPGLMFGGKLYQYRVASWNCYQSLHPYNWPAEWLSPVFFTVSWSSIIALLLLKISLLYLLNLIFYRTLK